MPVVTTDGYSFHFNDRICTFPGLNVQIQELLNNVSEAHADLGAQDDDRIADWSGKVAGVRAGLFTDIVFVWFNGWRGKFPDQGGPATVNGIVEGGSMAAFLGDVPDPAAPTQFPLAPASFVSPTVSQSISGVILGIDEIKSNVAALLSLL